MRVAGPHLIILYGVAIRLGQPGSILRAARLIRFIYGDDHGTQEGWLRASEVVGAIGVEHSAIMLNFEQEIINHPSGDAGVAGAQQAPDDEVTVPTIHFVESPAGNNIRVFQEQEAGGANSVALHFSRSADDRRKMFNADAAQIRKFQ